MRKKIYPLAFRLTADERQALKALAACWGVKQVEVLRRLLREAAEREQAKIEGKSHERQG